MNIKTTEEISNEFNDKPEWDDKFDLKKWVSVEDIKKELNNILTFEHPNNITEIIDLIEVLEK